MPMPLLASYPMKSKAPNQCGGCVDWWYKWFCWGNMTYHAQNSLSVTSKVSPLSIIFGIGKLPLFGPYHMKPKAQNQYVGCVDWWYKWFFCRVRIIVPQVITRRWPPRHSAEAREQSERCSLLALSGPAPPAPPLDVAAQPTPSTLWTGVAPNGARAFSDGAVGCDAVRAWDKQVAIPGDTAVRGINAPTETLKRHLLFHFVY